MSLPMTFACGLYDRMLALQTGEISPDGIDLNFLVMDNPREIFDRMSNRLEFDACEMSSSEFVATASSSSTASTSSRRRISPASGSACRSTPRPRRCSSAA
jgi:hypothetical protein